MSDAYVECMVKGKNKPFMSFLKYLLWAFACVLALIGILGYTLVLFLAIAVGVGAYFLGNYTSVEYEYLYLDKEITVDKIYNQSKRKRFAVYSVDKIEIMAPMKSWHLDAYKNRDFKVEDISSGVEQMPEVRYIFFYDGKTKVIFEPNAEMVKMLRNIAPRKVFVD